MPLSWPATVDALRPRLGEEAVSRWLEPLRVVEESPKRLTLQAPNEFFRDWILEHYQTVLTDAVGGRQICVLVGAAPALPAPSAPAAAPASRTDEPRRGLNPKLTFEQFVVGPSNRFAHAASMAVAESPAKAYNPLFIYGGVGLGKTHLMQAIGHAILSRGSSGRVCYMSSEQFTNELITAIQTKTTSRFRERYRTVDALLLDDIHFIAGKEATQEEFFHTFNSLYDAHKQIVISSDRSPKDIAGLEERLVSRFEWGLVTDIQPPDLETRIAILRKKAEDAAVEVPAPVIEFIAQQVKSNIRELEGALIRVVAYARFFSKSLAVEVAQEVLKEMVEEVASRITIPLIQQRVAEHFGILPEAMKSANRQRSVLFPRQMAMFLCRKLTDYSLPEIGQAFGGRDHSTVIHAIEKISNEIQQDKHKRLVLERLSERITTRSQ